MKVFTPEEKQMHDGLAYRNFMVTSKVMRILSIYSIIYAV